MSVKINYIKTVNKVDQINYTLFLKDNFELKIFKNLFNANEIDYIQKILKNSYHKKKIYSFNLDPKKSIIIVKIDKDTNEENLGAEFYNFIKLSEIKSLCIYEKSLSDFKKNFIHKFIHGMKLKSYEFKLYKSENKKK